MWVVGGRGGVISDSGGVAGVSEGGDSRDVIWAGAGARTWEWDCGVPAAVRRCVRVWMDVVRASTSEFGW